MRAYILEPPPEYIRHSGTGPVSHIYSNRTMRLGFLYLIKAPSLLSCRRCPMGLGRHLPTHHVIVLVTEQDVPCVTFEQRARVGGHVSWGQTP